MSEPPEQPSEQAYVERITERLRRDHPDPKIRVQLYDEGGLPDYVRALMREVEDEALLDRVVAGVRAAEDGVPTH
ncbi:MAG: hypothetical protein WKG01_34670 [Kofleriaceae bacterium]